MDARFNHAGAWAIAILMVVVASWVFYRFLAPKSWHEWASAGLVQAFIIALYAEMYGFPLTIYLLVRYFGLDQTHLSANLWSTLVGVGETGMMVAMIVGYGLLFLGIGLFAQGWRELYRGQRSSRSPSSRRSSLRMSCCHDVRKRRYWPSLATNTVATKNKYPCFSLGWGNGRRCLSALPSPKISQNCDGRQTGSMFVTGIAEAGICFSHDAEAVTVEDPPLNQSDFTCILR